MNDVINTADDMPLCKLPLVTKKTYYANMKNSLMIMITLLAKGEIKEWTAQKILGTYALKIRQIKYSRLKTFAH